MRTASVAGFRHRAESVAGGEVVQIDGLLLSLTNLPDASLNGTCVASEPADPGRALAAAEAAFRARGMPWFGLELERGEHPEVERAARDARLVHLFTRPALAVALDELRPAPDPEGIVIEPVEDPDGLAAMRAVEVEAFGTAPDVAEGRSARRRSSEPTPGRGWRATATVWSGRPWVCSWTGPSGCSGSVSFRTRAAAA
ncbi:MAG: hypothetical protein U0V56_02545 [Actinomycetota bacterium]